MSLESSRRYRAENLEKVRAKDRVRGRLRWIKNPKAMTETNRRCRIKRRLQALAHYGGECACCGEKRTEFLAIDHINGGGIKHRKEIDRKSTRLNSSHIQKSRMPSSA